MEGLERKFNRLTLSRQDFAEAIEYLDCIESNEPSVARRAFLSMAVISYARPFRTSYGAGRASALIKPPLDEVLTPEERQLHSGLLELRDQAIAHSDYEIRPTRRVPTPGLSGMMSRTRPFDVQSEVPSLDLFRSTARKLEHWCTGQCIRLDKEMDDPDTACQR